VLAGPSPNKRPAGNSIVSSSLYNTSLVKGFTVESFRITDCCFLLLCSSVLTFFNLELLLVALSFLGQLLFGNGFANLTLLPPPPSIQDNTELLFGSCLLLEISPNTRRLTTFFPGIASIPLPDLLFFNSEEQVSQQHIAVLIQKGILFFGISLKGSVLVSLFFLTVVLSTITC
jgi:hypothetical protein